LIVSRDNADDRLQGTQGSVEATATCGNSGESSRSSSRSSSSNSSNSEIASFLIIISFDFVDLLDLDLLFSPSSTSRRRSPLLPRRNLGHRPSGLLPVALLLDGEDQAAGKRIEREEDEEKRHERRPCCFPFLCLKKKSNNNNNKKTSQPFPSSLDEAIRMARKATRAALDSGAVSVAEVEMPSSALYAVMGDAEGANEMTYSAELLRDFLREWEPRLGSKVRVFFPDKQELAVVTRGRWMDPAAGSAGVKASFAQTSCSLDFLTDPTFLGDMGLDVKKRDASKLFDPDGKGERDELLVIAYPSFNVNEMIAVDDAWKAMTARRAKAKAAEGASSSKPPPPVVIFNGELERIYSGYYPPMFYRRLAKVASAKDGGVLASAGSDATYYIKNFKGSNPGILYRCW